MFNLVKKFAQKYPVWVLYMILSLIFAQGMYTHVHTHNGDLSTLAHVHNGPVHVAFSVDKPHPDDEAIIDVELSKQGIVKKLSANSLFIALVSVLVLFLLPLHGKRVFFRRETWIPPLSCSGALTPPLRAPPQ